MYVVRPTRGERVSIFGTKPAPAEASLTPIIPSIEALVVERDMYKARVEAELQRAVEARRREHAAIDEARKVRAETEARVQKIVESASFALDEAKRRIGMIGRGS